MTNSILDEAFACWERGDLRGAIALYRGIIAQEPDNMFAHAYMGQTLLALGEFEEGLREHEWRPLQRRLPWPRWRGENLAGRTLFLHGEQGFGDNFQFVRFASPLARLGARVVVMSREGMRGLLSTCPGVAAVVEPGETVSAIDYELPMLSAPLLLGTRIETIPAETPYLRADPARVAFWAEKLRHHPGRKVGLVWAGNPVFPYDARRSPGFAPVRQLLDVPGHSFFGLQIGPGREAVLGRDLPLVDLGGQIASFDDLAAIMCNMDLVISSCTAPAHLAGALGVPVWVALAWVADWRWFRDRDDSPWYPTARLFRQGPETDWDPVYARMKKALEVA